MLVSRARLSSRKLTDKQVLFDGSEGSTFDHSFLSNLKNVEEVKLDNKEKARVLIRYIQGKAFGFCFEILAESKALSEDKRFYEFVKNVLYEQFVPQGDAKRSIE